MRQIFKPVWILLGVVGVGVTVIVALLLLKQPLIKREITQQVRSAPRQTKTATLVKFDQKTITLDTNGIQTTYKIDSEILVLRRTPQPGGVEGYLKTTLTPADIGKTGYLDWLRYRPRPNFDEIEQLAFTLT